MDRADLRNEIEICQAREDGSLAEERDQSKRTEHANALALAPIGKATHIAVASGNWSDPSIWLDRQVPDRAARVYVPFWVGVNYDAGPGSPALDWLRVDGKVAFAPDRSTDLHAVTIVVAIGGTFEVGSPTAPVASGVQASIIFGPRHPSTSEDDKEDLGGGLVSLGNLAINGELKVPFVLAEPLVVGSRSIKLSAPATGWKIGDRLVIPGVDFSNTSDEEFNIRSISSDARSIVLSGRITKDHSAPAGVQIPIANLTRNVQFRSETASPLSARGHIMMMHQQTGIQISGASFIDLGRTDAKSVHTIPAYDGAGEVKPESIENTIGRYAVHFHMRSGAERDLSPNTVRDSVVWGAPKHGIVNHGGNVVAEDNVTYRVNGSHFFAENGSEIGAFRHNLAIRSLGSGEAIRSREFVGDLGHGGHGFWSQSSAVEMSDNFAFGQAEGAYVIFGYPLRENGSYVLFDSNNLGSGNPERTTGLIPISNPSFTFKRNTAAGVGNGLEVWVHKIYSAGASESIIEGFSVWNFRTYGVFLPYSKNISIQTARIEGAGVWCGCVGIRGNEMTENIRIKDASTARLAVGIQAPSRGRNSIVNARLDALTGIEIPAPTGPSRVIEIADSTMSGSGQQGWHSISMGPFRPPINADIAMLFEDDRVYLKQGNEARQLYFAEQADDHVPLPDEGPSVLRGLSNQQLHDQFGLSVGGGVVPHAAPVFAGSNALIGSTMPDPITYKLHPRTGTLSYVESLEPQYPMASVHFEEKNLASGQDEWRILKDPDTGREKLVYIDRTPPELVLTPSLYPLEIHPDDIKYGYRVEGMLYDVVGSRVALRAFTQDFLNLSASDDGFVRLDFEVHDLSQNAQPIHLALRVTKDAVRRGSNLSFFSQRQYCGSACDAAWQVKARQAFALAHGLDDSLQE
nr:G8 domain-containing protein [Bradyrhizobium oropedii]